MRRRDFITGAGAAAGINALGAKAEQHTALAAPTIGFLSGGSSKVFAQYQASFLQGLEHTGFVEHRNIDVEYRWAEGQFDSLPSMAADLVSPSRSCYCSFRTSCGTGSKGGDICDTDRVR